ncbi:surface protease GP63 [Trypanosoma rangeli]|uniref:Leishmanolysin-like peptidase n=1 Tax=Trypanosoma rangeli TaxID=5698 RepID=A0A3R7R818_TRYRA|nr:surface protease GP63 [Trypanosoma rangeli]RNE97562.1 surface protease GP63 [Trypanosoma rangeli]|eukprot:RNE97562.1 surface protease GP63 [Trypanosoma rangeli]
MGNVRPSATAVLRELPRKGQGATQAYTVATKAEENSGWAPIRIAVSTEDLKDTNKYCTKEGEMKPDFRGQNSPCKKADVLTPDMIKTIVDEILPVAVGLHAERLLVQRVKTPFVVLPFTEKQGNCQYFKVPEAHQKTGVTDADMVLYVASGLDDRTWAVPCMFGEDGRPIAGALHIMTMPFNIFGVMHPARATAHAIAYALGFNKEEMMKHDMLLNETGVRGGTSSVTVVKSPVTLNKTKLHYGCDTIPGMELYNHDGVYLWSLRNAKDELMSLTGERAAGYYTALTMAAFEDLGYYKAVWGMEEPMAWGRNSGCNFLDKPCSEETPTTYPDMFCDKKDLNLLRCTSNRQAIGTCFYNAVAKDNGGEKEICNYILLPGSNSHNMFCTLEGVGSLPGSLRGKGSWCLDAEPVTFQTKDNPLFKQLIMQAVCAVVQCEGGKVKVKYLGGSDFELCPEGKSITPKSPHFKDGRKIKCPRYEEVCTIAADGRSLINPKKGGHDGCAAVFVLSSLLLAAIAAVVAATVPL